MYTLLRAIAGVALRWFYRDIQIEGIDRVPRDRPLLLVVNHPNALVDALLVGWAVPRRVLITAKSTLFVNPLADRLLRWLGVLPLRRASDEPAARAAASGPARNRETFQAVHDALLRRGAVLIFPEGKSHDEPSLAPLKTGAARMALHARDAGNVPGLSIVPIGLTFERKDAPRTRVLVQVGEPIPMDGWQEPPDAGSGGPSEALTHEIDSRLRAVTANYATADDAARAVRLANVVAAVLDPSERIGVVSRTLGVEMAIARRMSDVASRLDQVGPATRARVDTLVERLEAVRRMAGDRGILLEDVNISVTSLAAARFTAREGWLMVTAGPVALWGRLNHWLPFRAARAVASRNIDSAADPAMRTLVAGAAFVLIAYLAQTAAVMALWGGVAGLVYLASLPVAAEINLNFSDRVRRAVQRARAFFLFRRDPGLQKRLIAEIEQLREAVTLLDDELRRVRITPTGARKSSAI
jgi:glycerol-3-phosphate O-acyltransferase/dihydroxyacetone phosphate acyltransferase